MDIDDMLDMAKDILPDLPELIGSLSEFLPEPSQKFLAMALKLLFGSIGIVKAERDRKALADVGEDLSVQFPAEIAEELREFCQQFQEDGPIIPPEYRKRYLETVFAKYPAFSDKPQLYNAFSLCVSKLEKAIRNNYSIGELSVARLVMSLRNDMEEISRVVLDAAQVGEDTNRIARENNQMLKDMRNNRAAPQPQLNEDTLNTSNGTYKDMFEERLFLHKEDKNSEVKLCNLFVSPKFREKHAPSDETINNYLTRFIQSDKSPQFLFIEGDAGCGKSSLTAYLSYHYNEQGKQDQTAQQIFGDTQLITIRLRNLEDIPTNCKNAERLKRAILRFLYGEKQTDPEKLKRFQSSGPRLLWLDGYDELCTMEGIEDPQSVLWGLENLNCKIVVTTRPEYIRFDSYRKYKHITLQHFDHDQREKWLEYYQTKCKATLDELNRQYLERIQDENDTAGICDTPLGLYMVAAGHFTAKELENEWALYRQIFYKEIQQTKYNENYGDFTSERIDPKYWESIYRVSEEIAWYLYQHNNADLLIPEKEVKKIINALNFEEDERTVVDRCLSLCGYWKTDTKQGCVEFYHNNIRDFFLCEKLMRELNRIYEEYGDSLQDDNAEILPFLKRLCELFQYGKLEKRVLWFLRQRSAYADKEEPDICTEIEARHHNTTRIFEHLLMRGEPYVVCKDRQEQENPIKTVIRILSNTVGLYRYLYEPFLQKGEYIKWWSRDWSRNVWFGAKHETEDTLLRWFAGAIFHLAGLSDLHEMNWDGADLEGANWNGVNLSYGSLRGATGHPADLQGADLSYADLSGASLYIDSRNVNLYHADLRRIRLHESDLRGVILEEANLSHADLTCVRLDGVNLRNANLTYANLSGSHLEGTDLRGAQTEGCIMNNIHGTPIMD